MEAQTAKDSKMTEEEKEILYQKLRRIRLKYGFLFNGYKYQNFYWEILILYRKIGIIMVTVFLSVISPEAQVLVAIFLVIANMFLQIRFDPFYTNTLNKMESYSLLVASITMYSGMYYITGVHYSYMERNGLKWFFLICLIIPNAMFFLYWIFNMAIEVIKEAHRRGPKIFKVMTCGLLRYDNFKSKYMANDIQSQLQKQLTKIHKDFDGDELAEPGESNDNDNTEENMKRTDFDKIQKNPNVNSISMMRLKESVSKDDGMMISFEQDLSTHKRILDPSEIKVEFKESPRSKVRQLNLSKKRARRFEKVIPDSSSQPQNKRSQNMQNVEVNGNEQIYQSKNLEAIYKNEERITNAYNEQSFIRILNISDSSNEFITSARKRMTRFMPTHTFKQIEGIANITKSEDMINDLISNDQEQNSEIINIKSEGMDEPSSNIQSGCYNMAEGSQVEEFKVYDYSQNDSQILKDIYSRSPKSRKNIFKSKKGKNSVAFFL